MFGRGGVLYRNFNLVIGKYAHTSNDVSKDYENSKNIKLLVKLQYNIPPFTCKPCRRRTDLKINQRSSSDNSTKFDILPVNSICSY